MNKHTNSQDSIPSNKEANYLEKLIEEQVVEVTDARDCLDDEGNLTYHFDTIEPIIKQTILTTAKAIYEDVLSENRNPIHDPSEYDGIHEEMCDHITKRLKEVNDIK